MREGLELLVGEGRRRGTEEGDDLVIGVGDGARSGEGQEKGGSAAAAAGGEATVAAAAAARGCRRGAPRRDEACVYESRGGEGVERDVEGCFSKEDEVSRRSFGGSRRAAASRASSPSPSVERNSPKVASRASGALASSSPAQFRERREFVCALRVEERCAIRKAPSFATAAEVKGF